jgi:hypothetical protein
MNCQQCLEELSTISLREMPADSPVMQHCATCPDCARLTTSLRDREYEAATLFNNLPPLSSPLSVAESAATLSRRRRVGRVVVTLSGIGGALIVALVATTMIVPAINGGGIMDGGSPARLRTETIALTCLSPAQAADIINPYVRSHGSTYYTPTSGISAITVRGTGEELARSRNLIHDFESDPAAACHNSLSANIRAIQKEVDDAVSDVKPEIAGSDVNPTVLPRPPALKKK